MAALTKTQKLKTSNSATRSTSFLLYVTLGIGFLVCCLLANILLVMTVHGSAVVRASKDLPNSDEVPEIEEEVDPQMETAMRYLFFMWTINFINSMITIPRFYSALEHISNRMANGLLFHKRAPTDSFFRFHGLLLFCILMAGVAVNATAYFATVLGTPDDICTFAVASFIFACIVGITAHLFMKNVLSMSEHMNSKKIKLDFVKCHGRKVGRMFKNGL
ncbi:unnamed protein product [Orchesella dallaii]|uniref:Uncharacterized protein n=1 Tax=Orchesella dallaii TaxID=48710 RepID=A0ABP1PL76_9HEXA